MRTSASDLLKRGHGDRAFNLPLSFGFSPRLRGTRLRRVGRSTRASKPAPPTGQLGALGWHAAPRGASMGLVAADIPPYHSMSIDDTAGSSPKVNHNVTICLAYRCVMET
jgi:hypothetical protein